ncbi:MAG: hypothetical protein MPK08_08100 [Alphaproteobacteria bacterium]|nr:hypothetical protein [Alphaproteobacteria bacterium]
MARSLALVGEAFRLLRSPLKRTAPTDACGRCPQKNKFVLSLIKGRTTITVPIDPSLALVGVAFGLSVVRSLALVGGAFRLLKSPLKRAVPTDARGRCPQKNKFVLSLIKGRTTITVPISQSLALAGVYLDI